MTKTSAARKRWTTAGLSICIFVLSFFAFDRLLMHGLRRSATAYYAALKTDTLKGKKDAVFGQGDDDALIFGSSRADTAFRQDILSARLNKRIIKETGPGRFPRFFYYYYQKYRQENPPPKILFYGMDYFMFEKESSLEDLAGLDKTITLDALNPAGTMNGASPLLSRVSWLYRKKPDIDSFISSLIKREAAPTASAREDVNAAPVVEEAAPPRRRPLVLPPGFQVQADQAHWYRPRRYMSHPGVEGAYLQKLLTVLEQDGVQVFLVIIPDYKSTNDTNFEQKKYKRDILTLARPFPNAVVLDYNRRDLFNLSDASLFWKGDWGKTNCHLSYEGMTQFSRKLGTKVRTMTAGNAAPNEAKPRSQT
ncbi:MAG: hypothetical protein A2Y56_01325 [Candidatus Aminicenantes bacterium RBG_13_63_10]|nr:MAG: hypothetical protein A2Y56_01325 [Candidatus Aminicenantes bacterium RBG_13_63_10]